MELLYIRVKNGEPQGHPITISNLKACGYDASALPPEFLPFRRRPSPAAGATASYVIRNGYVEERWEVGPEARERLEENRRKNQEALAYLNLPGSSPDVV